VYIITKRFDFSASHQLDSLPDGHQCKRLHGHNYIIEVELSANELNEHGFVVDFGELKPLKDYIDNTLDHRHLNDVLPFQTTAENLAKHLFDWSSNVWAEVTAVRVSETLKTWAEYRNEL